LDNKANVARGEYKAAVQVLFQKGGDSHIDFADSIIKVNRHGDSQLQSIVVTDRNVYKYNPKSFKMIKVGTPVNAITGIHLSNAKDTFIVVECKPPFRDFVLDVGTNNCERFSELATVLFKRRLDAGVRIKVDFGASINFNNARKEGAPGQDVALTFAPHPKPPAKPGNKFTGPSKGAAIVYF